MKTKFLFASLFASAVMVGCSNEELSVVQDTASNDKLALIFDGVEGVESRMAYDGTHGTFKWEVGDVIGVSRVAGKGVTTNYSFTATKVTDDNTKDLGNWNTTAGAADKYAYFETAFGSIFKGDYVVYYPYNPNFCEDGKIIAKLNIGQTEVTADKTEHVAADGFMMSKAVAFEGGQKAEKFALYPVFGRLAINIKTQDNCEIETVVLRSLNGKTLPTEMEIDADINVVDGKLNPAYMHVIESSKVEEIVMSVDGTDAVADAIYGYTAYFTLIPGTYTNFAIDVVTDKGTYTKTFNRASISSGNRAEVPLTFASSDMVLKRTYYVTSAASWTTAIEKIAASMTQSEAAPATIKVINDVKLDATNTLRPSQAIHNLVPVTVVGEGSLEVVGSNMGDGALTDVTFNIPVKANFVSEANEKVNFAAGLKGATVSIRHSGSSYNVEGGEIGELTIGSIATTAATFNNVTFNTATSSQTAPITRNVTKVNFNDCTFKNKLENNAGAIRVNNATIVDPTVGSAHVNSKLDVKGGEVYAQGTVTVEDADVVSGAKLFIETNANVAFDKTLAAIAGEINVEKDATLTLGSTVSYVMNGNVKVEGKLINNGILTALNGAVIDDMTQNNHKGILENNGTVRVNKAAYDGVWYNNQNIAFENNANYNIILGSATVANFNTYVAKSDITGVEISNDQTTALSTSLKGKGNNANVIDFSNLNLILNAKSGDINATITNGAKWKNIEVKGAYEVTFAGVSKNASISTGDLNVNGTLTIDNAGNDAAKVNVTNVAVAKNAVLAGGAQVTYTGTFTNKGTVSGGNPVK